MKGDFVWLHEPRSNPPELFMNFEDAFEAMQESNGCTWEECVADGTGEGSAEEGYMSADDGARIRLLRIR